MDTADECIGFKELQGVRLRSGIDHRTVITRAGGGRWIARDQGDEAFDQGIFTDVAECFHGAVSSGRLKYLAANCSTTVAPLKQKCTAMGAHNEPVFS